MLKVWIAIFLNQSPFHAVEFVQLDKLILISYKDIYMAELSLI